LIIEKKIKGYVNSYIRRAFGYSLQYKACKDSSKVSTGVYRCKGCEALIDKNGKRGIIIDSLGEVIFADKLFVDHIDPVVPLRGFTSDIDWASRVIGRILCGLTNLQYLCGCCHYLKTQWENGERRIYKKELKNG
tara:strand:+ start:261 stop:665 length:405 start_codon:yes stop_codon:yes gene_type:complete